MTIFKGDLPGNDLGSTNTPTFSMCCSQCQNYLGCMAFTWVSTPGAYFGMCYLKSSSGGSNTPFNDHISAYYWAHTTIQSTMPAADCFLKIKNSSLYSSLISIEIRWMWRISTGQCFSLFSWSRINSCVRALFISQSLLTCLSFLKYERLNKLAPILINLLVFNSHVMTQCWKGSRGF